MSTSNCQPDTQMQLDATTAQAVRHLKTIDLELAYLALLTREGLKPLSRWEKPLDQAGLDGLEQVGLLTRQVPRSVRNGQAFTETVFGKAPAYIELYASHFENLPVDKSAETVRVEGFVFGYPPCCVAHYIRRPYAPNEFPMEKQKVLFHWACKGCILTPLLTPAYERIYRLTESL